MFGELWELDVRSSVRWGIGIFRVFWDSSIHKWLYKYYFHFDTH